MRLTPFSWEAVYFGCMATNPYASFLADSTGITKPLEIIKATPVKIENLLQSLGPEKLNIQPAPGKWSVRDILSHLADCEIVFAFRLRQALAEDRHVIQPFDQDQFARTYNRYDARMAASVFAAVRQWNLALIAGLPEEDFDKPLNHPERGDMKLTTVIETMAGHDRNHLKQIEALAA
jgi:uncharacterized damage-inducible protein DinB